MPANQHDITMDLGEARDQGQSPTCLSFSCSEIHRASRGFVDLLSPESLHRGATTRAGKPASDGLTLSEAIETLDADGQTTEVDWPYNSDQPLNAGSVYLRARGASLPFDHNFVLASLGANTPIALIIDVDVSFFTCDGITPLDLIANSQIQGRHAVVVCGIRASSESCSYLIKNSWGTGWGNGGYAWLTLSHVSARSPLLVRI